MHRHIRCSQRRIVAKDASPRVSGTVFLNPSNVQSGFLLSMSFRYTPEVLDDIELVVKLGQKNDDMTSAVDDLLERTTVRCTRQNMKTVVGSSPRSLTISVSTLPCSYSLVELEGS